MWDPIIINIIIIIVIIIVIIIIIIITIVIIVKRFKLSVTPPLSQFPLLQYKT